MHVDLADGLKPLQGHVGQHVGLDTAEEHVVLHLVRLLLVILLGVLAELELELFLSYHSDNLEKNRFCFNEK